MPTNSLKNIITKFWFFYIKAKNNKSFYRISGMRRSGNHAIINWIIKQRPGATCFNNNMGPFHPPEDTIIKKIIVKGLSKFNLFVSLEDKWTKDAFKAYDPEKFGEAKLKFNLLILRDPYNMLASRWVWKDEFGSLFRENLEHRKMIIEMWKDHARIFLNWQKNEEEVDGERNIPVNYNRWFTDKDYREKLAQRLDLKFTDAGKEDISIYGHGSSFSKQKFDQQASKLKVLERWMGLVNDLEYRALFQDSELRDLASSIFDVSEMEKALFDSE